jgi:uncharacterized protein (DUF58 family)
MVVLITDLLADTGSLRTRLGYLRSQGHEVVLLRVLDPAELAFDFKTPAMFEDMESGKDLYVDPLAIRDQYRANFTRHAEAVDKICRDLGITLFPMSTSQPLELALFDVLQVRLRAGRQVARAGGHRSAGGV